LDIHRSTSDELLPVVIPKNVQAIDVFEKQPEQNRPVSEVCAAIVFFRHPACGGYKAGFSAVIAMMRYPILTMREQATGRRLFLKTFSRLLMSMKKLPGFMS